MWREAVKRSVKRIRPWWSDPSIASARGGLERDGQPRTLRTSHARSGFARTAPSLPFSREARDSILLRCAPRGRGADSINLCPCNGGKRPRVHLAGAILRQKWQPFPPDLLLPSGGGGDLQPSRIVCRMFAAAASQDANRVLVIRVDRPPGRCPWSPGLSRSSVRLPFLLKGDGFFTADEGVEGLMARHLGDLPVFFWVRGTRAFPRCTSTPRCSRSSASV